MSGYECYKQYLALKTHFTQESYNYFKYNKNSNYRFMGDWNLKLEKDPLWSSKFMLIKKYRPFLTFDLGNVRNVCNEAFST